MRSEEFWAFKMISKACHDLATPLSSLGMALELQSPHEDINPPLQQAHFHLKLWRFLASKTTPDITLSFNDFLLFFKEHLRSERKWALDVQLSDMTDFDPTTVKLHAVMVIVAKQILTSGGKIDLHTPFELSASGPRCIVHDDVKDALLNLKTIETIGSRGILTLYAQEFLLKPFGLCFDLQTTPTSLVLRVKETKTP